MPDYQVFGGTLRADLEFPELRPADGGRAPDWRLSTVSGTPPMAGRALLAREQLMEGPTLAAWKTDRGFQLEYSDTGTFDISERGARLEWYPGPDAPTIMARSDVIGRVLAVALHLAGFLCLHASAVTLGEGTVAFLAPKFTGKSTLAMALTRTGATLVTDDTFAVRPAAPVRCLPGVHTIRLRPGAAAHLVDRQAEGVVSGDRHLVNWLPAESLTTAESPVAALYVLTPVAADSDAAAARTRLAPLQAALALVTHTKLGDVLTGAPAQESFGRAIDVARNVPVFELRVARDLDRIADVVTALHGWHVARS